MVISVGLARLAAIVSRGISTSISEATISKKRGVFFIAFLFIYVTQSGLFSSIHQLFSLMTINPDFLIVYGTLRPPLDNPFALYLRQRGRYVGDGQFLGQLFKIDSYPGAIYSAASPTLVHGTVFEIGQQKETILAYLDYYEGVGDAFENPTEFVRVTIPITVAGQVINCWIYLYNLPTANKPLIESGDYLLHLNNPLKTIV